MSGHSKFANIKHKKEKNDAAKGKIFTIIGREIAVAVKEGGPDPANNFKLATVIAKAKANNMPNDTIDRGIKKAAGDVGNVNYKYVTYEGYGPNGIAIIVDALTDNTNRTAANVRSAFTMGQGNVGTPGCVSFMFDKKGQIIVDKEECDMEADDLMMTALDAGAEDFSEEEGSFEILTDPDNFDEVRKALEDAGIASFGYNRIKILKIIGIKVGVTGIYELADHQKRASQVKQNIKALKKAGAQVIIVNFHWGIEKQYTPDENQKALAHLAVDEGADLVIGHHPHVLEGIEEYNGKYICYSLGNFCFGGNSTPSDTDSMIVQQTFTLNKKGKLTKSSKLNIIPCSISSSSGYNDYCPVPLTGDAKQRVLDKISQYSEGL